MERRLTRMREGYSQLQGQLSASKKAISEYLDLLETRAKQNKTPELKEQLLSDIDAQRTALEERLTTAEQAFSRLDGAIQKYDDILGYLQVHRGLDEVRGRLGAIDQTIVEAQQLNQDVDGAVREGIQIINKLRARAQNVAVPAPTTPSSIAPVRSC
jgi:DNA repair exonuclease SbcCD ATPase subunit